MKNSHDGERADTPVDAGQNALIRALNGHWPSTAIACALIDKGVLHKNDLLSIVDSLAITVASYAAHAEVQPALATAPLERFRRDLEQLELKPGKVLAELRRVE